jgi:Ca2+-binding EF-hand superfamily protein
MFRSITRRALTALPLAALTVCAFAQNTAPNADALARPSMFQHMLAKMDTDGDGRISLAEYLAAAKARFQAMDAENKGSVDAAAIAVSPAATERETHGAESMVRRLDTAGDGYVTEDEFIAAAKSRFARMDTRGDGKLTPDELTAPRWSHGQHNKAAGEQAQADTDVHAGMRAQFAQKYFDKLDANHDGVVTLDEYVAAAQAEFKVLDTAGNGQVTAAEIAASPKVQHRANHLAERMVRRLDTNGDGVVSQEEYLADAQKQFARMDKNGDGFIDAEEMPTHHWARRNAPPTN